MSRVSGRIVHWFCRYSSRRTTFSNILPIWANKNGDKSAIFNLILTKLHSIHGRIVINACVKDQKKYSLVLEIFIRMDKSLTDGQTETQMDGRSPDHYQPQIYFFCLWIITCPSYQLQKYKMLNKHPLPNMLTNLSSGYKIKYHYAKLFDK